MSALNHLTASHLIIGAETRLPFKPPRSNAPLLNKILKEVIIVDSAASKDDTTSIRDTINFDDLNVSTNATVQPSGTLNSSDVVNIQFTSGTTSTPKAACLTHRSILNNGYSIGSRLLLTSDDSVCCPPPLFHCFGSILGYMATATHGAAIVFPSPAFDPEASLYAVQEEQCTALYGMCDLMAAPLGSPTIVNSMIEVEVSWHSLLDESSLWASIT